MKAFLSHAASDASIARFLKTCFEKDLGVDILMFPDDAPPGCEWIDQIRKVVEDSDELFSLATPESIGRPWISAEWACFWFQRKPCTPLLVNVHVGQLWDPMRAYQGVDLLNPSLSMLLLGRLAAATNVQPQDGLLPLAHAIADEVPKIRERQARASMAEVLARVTTNVESGTDNVSRDDVALLVRHERLPELLALASSRGAAAVKQRQIATALASVGRLGEALQVTRSIGNLAEAKNVALHVVRGMDRGLGQESEEWAYLFGVFDILRPPQRRDVRDEMIRNHVAPLGVWADPPAL